MALPEPRPGAPKPAPDWEPMVRAIGPKVRELRQRLGLSLQQLAGRAEVSAAAIHKVERGDMVPTITTLLKLAAALGQPLGYFVGDTEPAPAAVHVRADQRPAAPTDWAPAAERVTAAALALPNGRLRATAVHTSIAPGGSSGARPVRAGEELVLVLDGVLEVEVAGERYRLEPGDTLHYPTDRPASWREASGEPVHAVWWTLR